MTHSFNRFIGLAALGFAVATATPATVGWALPTIRKKVFQKSPKAIPG